MRGPAGGQAAIELLAMVPVVILAGLVAWQLAAVIGAGLAAQEEVRARALTTTAAGAVVTVSARVAVPTVVPGVRGLSVPSRVGGRTP